MNEQIVGRTIHKNYVYHTDAGHGWLQVPRDQIISAGITEKISKYSYVDDRYVYLEEDCDAGVFIRQAEMYGDVCFPDCRFYSDPAKYGERVKVKVNIATQYDGDNSYIRSKTRYENIWYISDIPSDYDLVENSQDIKALEEIYPELSDHAFVYLWVCAYNGDILDIWGSYSVYDGVRVHRYNKTI